jgi:hypothetical protein
MSVNRTYVQYCCVFYLCAVTLRNIIPIIHRITKRCVHRSENNINLYTFSVPIYINEVNIIGTRLPYKCAYYAYCLISTHARVIWMIPYLIFRIIFWLVSTTSVAPALQSPKLRKTRTVRREQYRGIVTAIRVSRRTPRNIITHTITFITPRGQQWLN